MSESVVREDVPSRRSVLLTVVTFVAVGLVGGLLWLWLADPAQWQVRENGIVLTEGAAKGQFSVIVTFVLIGVVGSLLSGALAAWTMPTLGWLLTPFVVVLAVAASLITWRIGVDLGPAGPHAGEGAVGDLISSQFKVDALAAFVVWPVAALLGVVTVLCLDRREDHELDVSQV